MKKEKLLLLIKSENIKDKEILKQISQHPTIQPIFEELVEQRKRVLIVDFFNHKTIKSVEFRLSENQAESYVLITINKGEWKLELFKIFKDLQKVCKPFEITPDFLNSSPLFLEEVKIQGKFLDLAYLIPPRDILPDEEIYMW